MIGGRADFMMEHNRYFRLTMFEMEQRPQSIRDGGVQDLRLNTMYSWWLCTLFRDFFQ